MTSMYAGIKNFFRISAFLFMVVSLFSCAYSNKAAQKLLDKSTDKVYDIVVVPGLPYENGKWGRIMRGRVYWAKFLYDKGIVKNIMFSGSSVYSPYYEGKIMAMYAEAIGIPKENIFYEIKAEHSTENIYYSYYLAKKLGFKTIALASDPFQTKNLRRFSHRRLSPDIAMIPMLIDTMKVLEPVMRDPLIPSQEAYNEDFVSLKKREGFFKRLRGTMGRNIKKIEGEENK